MKLTVTIENFQSIRHAVVVFDSGITIITGSTNSGKTAIFRAIRCAILNPTRAKSYIQDGAKKAVVTLEMATEGGVSAHVTWIRTKTQVTYVINGQEFAKCGRQCLHDFMSTDTRFGAYPLGGENFHAEMDVLFPFGLSDAQRLRFIQKVSTATNTTKIDNQLKEKLSTSKKQHTAITSSHNVLTASSSTLHSVIKLRSSFMIYDLRSISNTLREMVSDQKVLKGSWEKYRAIGNLGMAVRDFEMGFKDVAEMEADFLPSVTSAKRSVRFTAAVDLIPVRTFDFSIGDDLQALKADADRVAALQKWIAVANAVESKSFLFEAPEGLHALQEAAQAATKLQASYAALLRDQKALEARREAVQEELAAFESCPACGGVVTPENECAAV